MRLALSGTKPSDRRSRFNSAAIRRYPYVGRSSTKRRISPASSTSPERSCGPRRGLWPSRRSITFERATPSIRLIVFTGYLREAASATARSVFCPCKIQSLLEDLDLHCLAAEQPLQFPHSLFETANFGSRHHLIIGA